MSRDIPSSFQGIVHYGRGGKPSPINEASWKSVNIYCDGCGTHGHHWRNCDFCTKLIKSLVFIGSLDAEKKQELLDTFTKDQAHKHTVKSSMVKARMHILREDGDINGLFNLIYAIKDTTHLLDSLEEHYANWQLSRFWDATHPPPDPAPPWTTTDITCTICHHAPHHIHALLAPSTEPNKLIQMMFLPDAIPHNISPSPFTVHYYAKASHSPPKTATFPIKIQLDGGTNHSLTNNAALLLWFQPLSQYTIFGINKDDIALQCTGRGCIPWIANDGDTLYVPCLYSPSAAKTIISPTDIVLLLQCLGTILTYTFWPGSCDILPHRGNRPYKIQALYAQWLMVQQYPHLCSSTYCIWKIQATSHHSLSTECCSPLWAFSPMQSSPALKLKTPL